MIYLDKQQVREKLAAGHDLLLYKETRNTFGGWAIDNYNVHGNTVNALERAGEIKERQGRHGRPLDVRRVMVAEPPELQVQL